jgi:translation initiation factor 1 (eIF-1/SUI1)
VLGSLLVLETLTNCCGGDTEKTQSNTTLQFLKREQKKREKLAKELVKAQAAGGSTPQDTAQLRGQVAQLQAEAAAARAELAAAQQ